MALQRGLRGGVAGRRGRGDRGAVERAAVQQRVVAREAGPADECLDAAAAAAVAGQQRIFPRRTPGQRVVAPLAGQAVRARQHPAVDRDAGAGAGAQDHREDDAEAGARAVGGFRQRQAVGVVGQCHRLAQQGHQVLLQRPAVQAGGVAVLHQAARRQCARRADADAERAVARAAGRVGERGDGLQRGAVVALRRGHALAPDQAAGGVEHHGLDLGAAEVDAECVGGRRARGVHPHAFSVVQLRSAACAPAARPARRPTPAAPGVRARWRGNG